MSEEIKSLQTMKEALSNVTEKQKAWFSGVWKSAWLMEVPF